MHNVITTYGGGELFNLVFNGIAALFKTDHTGILMPMMRVGLVVGSVYVLLLMLFRSQVVEGVKWFIWVIVATNLIFLPKTTIFIDDPLANKKFKVDNVPFALGTFAGLVSQIGKTVTEQFESVFTLPDYMPYHKTGTVFASALMRQVGEFRIVDPIFKGNMERFVNQCVVYGAMIGHKYTLKDLQNTPDIWALVSANASPVLGFLYKQGHEGGTVITCKAGATQLNDLWTAEITKATATYGSSVNNQTLTKAVFFTHIQNGFQLMAGISESADKLLRQEMMINSIEEASNNKLSELGSPSNYAATKALMQQRSAYAIAGDIASRTLPLFKNVIEALSYALFIFIVVLALLPNGYRILLTYTGILVWTQLWAPLYAVLNLIMTLYGKSETMAQGAANGLTILNSSAIINANADMMTLAAWFSVSIPFISYGILKQGAGAFVGLAHHLGSAMQQAASGAASEVVSGNISLGNVSMGTQSYQNTSAFQHNTSPTYSASHFKAINESGIDQSTFADGNQAFVDQAISRLSVQIMGSENTSFAQQTSLSNARSLLESKSVAASKASEAAFQNTTNFLTQAGQNVSKGEDYNQMVSSSDAKTLQNFKNFVSDIRESTGMTEAQAVEATVGMHAGTPGFLPVGIQTSTNLSMNAVRNTGIEAAKAVAKQTHYTDSLDKVVSAQKALSESKHDTKGVELGDSATASLNKANSLRDEVSVAQHQVETLSNDLSSSQSQSLSINKDLTQNVLEFIAHQPVNTGPNGVAGGQIGYKNARRILDEGGGEREAYLARFQEENPQYAIQSINSAKGQEQMDARYETESNRTKAMGGIDSQATEHREDILNKGSNADLNLNRTPKHHFIPDRIYTEEAQNRFVGLASQNASDAQPKQDLYKNQPKFRNIEQDTKELLKRSEQKIDKGKGEIDLKERDIQKAEKASQDKNIAGTVFHNATGNVFKDADLQKLHPVGHDHQ